MDSDRELLEMAAKAAGLVVEWDGDGYVIATKFRGHLTNYDAWNPLTDDGDALRLAVKLQITIQQSATVDTHEPSVETFDAEDRFSGFFEEVLGSDPCAATRRAIVRAAAELGRRG